MSESNQILIYKKLADIMQDITAIAKDGKNTMQNFNFRGIDQIYDSLHPLFKKHRIIVIPSIVKTVSRDVTTDRGKVMIERLVTMSYQFCAEDGSSVKIEMDGEARDSGDKTTSKAISMAYKTAMLQMFCIPVSDAKENDPDKFDGGGSITGVVKPKGLKQSSEKKKTAPINDAKELNPPNESDQCKSKTPDPVIKEIMELKKLLQMSTDDLKKFSTDMGVPSLLEASPQDRQKVWHSLRDSFMPAPVDPDGDFAKASSVLNSKPLF